MPGLAICLSREPITQLTREKLRQTADLMRHSPAYTSQSPIATTHVDIQFVAYPNYPSLHFDTSRSHVLLEGMIYNKSEQLIGSELKSLIENPGIADEQFCELVGKWVSSNDGEYIVVVHDKESGTFILITDALGRLPMFYQKFANEILIAREPKFIISVSGIVMPDRVGIAEFLMHGYNIGGRTMTAGLQRLPPAVIVKYNSTQCSLSMHKSHLWNLDELQQNRNSIKNCANDAAELFREATKTRALRLGRHKIALSLSGGLDSRAVGAALRRESIAFSAHTSLQPNRSNYKDYSVAGRVAEALSCPWRTFQLLESVPEDFVEIVRRQEGGSATWMAPTLQHYAMLRKESGDRTVLFTGDGGNNVMYSLLPATPVNSLDDILALTFDTVYYWDVGTVADLLQVSRDELRQGYADSIAHLPERTPTDKYRHHKFLGRPFRFVMEGEDRNRFEFWLGAPFWSTPFVLAMLSAPEKYRAHFRLYREILKRVDPSMLQITYAGTLVNIPIGLITIYSHANDFIKSHPALYSRLRTALVRSKSPGFSILGLDARLRDIVDRSPGVRASFDIPKLRRLMDDGMPWIKYHLLATVLLRVDLMERNYPRSGTNQY